MNYVGEYFAGNPLIARNFLSGNKGIVMLTHSLGVQTAGYWLKYLPFRNLKGVAWSLLAYPENSGSGLTGTYTTSASGVAGPGSIAGTYWLWQRVIYAVTAGGVVGADSGANSNRVFDNYIQTTAGLFYRPSGATANWGDGKSLKMSFFGYQNANGVSSFKVNVTDYSTGTLFTSLTGQSLTGSNGAVQFTTAATGVSNHGTNGFRMREKLTEGVNIPTGANLVFLDGFIEFDNEQGQSFAQIALGSQSIANYIDAANITGADLATQVNLYRGDIVVFALDVNAAYQGLTAQQYKDDMTTAATALAKPGRQFVILNQYDNTAADATAQANIRQAGKDWALARNGDSLWLDAYSYSSKTATLQALSLVDTDTLHFSTNGSGVDEKKVYRYVRDTAALLELTATAALPQGGTGAGGYGTGYQGR